MPKLKLSFNHKVALGFAIILALLMISGGMSLWNLNDISGSNQRVQEQAVPVVTEVNKVQIQLLKLANLSALGFNALSEADIRPYRDDFDKGAAAFAEDYKRLESLAQDDPQMTAVVADIKHNFATYNEAVRQMFDAKLAVLVAKQAVEQQVGVVMERSDDVGFSFMDIVNARAPSKAMEKDLALAQGFANQADALMAGVAKAAQELQSSSDLERLDSAQEDFEFIINGAMFWFDKVVPVYQPMDTEGYIDATYQHVEALRQQLKTQPNLIDHKREELTQAQTAWEQLSNSKAAVQKAVAGLDQVLVAADAQFNRLQGELADSVSFGFKSTLAMLIILLVLASQNFNSMRLAIRKKMIDLAKLNRIGGTLATARDQDTALDLVLHAMSEKIGIERGSVYLFNKDNELEAKAFLPPKQMDGAPAAITFTLGEGVIGRTAASKRVIFVPDTSRDSTYVAGEQEKAKALLCVPLLDKDILIGVMNVSGAVDKVNFADSDYEFVASVARSLVTTIKNIRMVEVIEEHNRTLEKKVEERTAALKQKNEDIANMFSNMHQGLFTIVDNGLIHPEYAAYLETIFETKEIANRNFVDFMLKRSTLNAEMIDGISTAVASIVGEDAMMYEFNSHLLIGELTLEFPGRPHKLIELDWDPIVDDQDVVTKLMVTVRDVTALKALQAEAEGQKQELMIIGEILAVDAEKFSAFIDGSSNLVGQCRTIIEQTERKDPGKLAELFRNIHTVKGNARTYGLKHITDTVHQVENTFDQLRKDEEKLWQPAELLEELAYAERALQFYRGIFKDKLGRDQLASGASLIDSAQLSQLLTNLATLCNAELPDSARRVVKATYQSLLALESAPLERVIADVLDSVASLADELDKPAPAILIPDHEVLIRKEAHSMIGNIFMHVLRNAIDHGIEGADERRAKGKGEQGCIRIEAIEDGGAITYAVRDDGRGVALTRIFAKAVEQGLYPADAPRPSATEVANLIFASGFSTADKVTEVSGRGVGMDAVRDFLESAGGSIEVRLDAGDEHADYRAFTTLIRLPAEWCTLQERFDLAS
ncbi:GAF domain-containing protein [Pseudomonas benzenivorans]|uniref:GAF domain-containing protein n=1 Tax=Pseudomonas benzenivorans TaxID=556533 RepID=A0ABY5HBD2_9PSED|nr:GAF domain-containing protein [Pseudomonas benzenivorans]UTW08674.1 GAF domain-containing protein [Pseudomonas benzenivorans]